MDPNYPVRTSTTQRGHTNFGRTLPTASPNSSDHVQVGDMQYEKNGRSFVTQNSLEPQIHSLIVRDIRMVKTLNLVAIAKVIDDELRSRVNRAAFSTKTRQQAGLKRKANSINASKSLAITTRKERKVAPVMGDLRPKGDLSLKSEVKDGDFRKDPVLVATGIRPQSVSKPSVTVLPNVSKRNDHNINNCDQPLPKSALCQQEGSKSLVSNVVAHPSKQSPKLPNVAVDSVIPVAKQTQGTYRTPVTEVQTNSGKTLTVAQQRLRDLKDTETWHKERSELKGKLQSLGADVAGIESATRFDRAEWELKLQDAETRVSIAKANLVLERKKSVFNFKFGK